MASSRYNTKGNFYTIGLALSFLFLALALICTLLAIGQTERPFPGFLIYKNMVVAPDTLPGWPGSQAGLRFMNRILAIDGKKASEEGLKRALSQKETGEPIKYTVSVGGNVREIVVPVRLFTFRNFLAIYGTYLIISFIYLTFGFIVLNIKPHLRASRAFFIFCFSLSGWFITGFDFESSRKLTLLLPFLQILTPASLIHLGMVFPGEKGFVIRRPALPLFLYAPALMLAAAYQITFMNYHSVWSAINYTYYICIGLSVTIFVASLIHTYRNPFSPEERQRAKVVLWGSLFAFLLPGFGTLTTTFYHVNVPFNALALLVILFPVAVAYSIVKHNLFEFDAIIRRSISYSIITAILVGLYILLLMVSDNIFRKFPLSGSTYFPILFSLAAVALYNSLMKPIQSFVDETFFKKKYDYRKVIDEVSNAMTTLLDVDDLVRQMLRVATGSIYAEDALFFLRDRNNRKFRIHRSSASRSRREEETELREEEPIIDILMEKKNAVSVKELLRDKRMWRHGPRYFNIFKATRASLLFPIIAKGELKGILFLGEKKTGAMYDREDLELLRLVSNQCAVALENSYLFKEIKETKDYLENLIESSADTIITTDRRGNIAFANRSADKVFGCSPQDLIGTKLYEYYTEGRKEAVEMMRLLKSKKRFQDRQIDIVSKSGKVCRCSLSASYIEDGNNRVIGTLALIRDMTEQRKMEQQMIQTERLKALGEMAGGVAHDFNNILSGVIGRAELLMRSTRDETIRTDLNKIIKAASDGAEIVRRIQEFTVLRPGNNSHSLMDINEIVDEVVDFTKTRWKSHAEAKKITFRINRILGEVPPVLGNAAETKEVLTNIILNAIDAMPDGGTISIKTSTVGKWVQISVADTGIGMSEEVRQKLFEPFFTTKGTRGTGLGMSVSYGIIARHKGEIHIQSKEGEGTTFNVLLPAASRKRIKKTVAEPAAPDCNAKGRILVIDDEEPILETLFFLLTNLGHEVTVARSGEDGLAIYRGSEFDVVLTDVVMPQVSGWDVLREVKRANPNTRVVMITGWSDKLQEEQFKASGADALVIKPFSINQIVNIISDALREKVAVGTP